MCRSSKVRAINERGKVQDREFIVENKYSCDMSRIGARYCVLRISFCSSTPADQITNRIDRSGV